MTGGLPQHTGQSSVVSAVNVSAASTTMGTVPAGKIWIVFAATITVGSSMSGVVAVAGSIELNGNVFLPCQVQETGVTLAANNAAQVVLSISDGIILTANQTITLVLNNTTGANASGSAMFREVPA